MKICPILFFPFQNKMDYSKHYRRPQNRRHKCHESSSDSCSSSEASRCKHVFKEETCKGHSNPNCRVKKCCKCGKIIICCKCRRGQTGPTGPTGPCCPGPTGPTGGFGPTGATGSVGPTGSSASVCLYGNGQDGDVDLCANPTAIAIPLTRDFYFNNLRVCGLVCTNSFRIFVRNTLTMEPGSVICNDGGDGGPCAGTGAPIGTCGRGTNGGLGIVTALRVFQGKGEDSDSPNIGGMGGDGQFPAGLLQPFRPTGGGPVLLNVFPGNTSVHDLNGLVLWGGTGGGGAVGAGGGGGAGIVVVSACRIEGTGEIRARGGNGSPLAGATGGGGGGAVILNYTEKSPSANITLNVQGGLGANGGQNGQPGNIYVVKVQLP